MSLDRDNLHWFASQFEDYQVVELPSLTPTCDIGCSYSQQPLLGSINGRLALMFLVFLRILPQNCTQTAPTAFLACRSTEYQCDDRVTCINKRWLCDGEQDCPSGEDEKLPNCRNITCRPDQFQCRDRTCIAGIFECSGKAECADGSDELNCSKLTRGLLIHSI